MCLAVPGKIIDIKDKNAIVDFGGSKREVSTILTPSAKLNDYVLVHAGFSIQILMPEDAKETIKLFEDIYGQNK
jgi:hydrogenase expression/formation protein HypC